MQVGIQLHLSQPTIVYIGIFQCLINIFLGFIKIFLAFIKRQSDILQCPTLIVSRHYIANGCKQQITLLQLPQFIIAVSLRQNVCRHGIHVAFGSKHLHCLIQ